MKKIFPLLLAITLLGGCEDDFLSPTPLDQVTVGNFYRTQADVDKAVSGVYAGMQSWPEDIYTFLSEVRSNNYIGVFHDAQRDWWDITTFDVKPESNTLQSVWGNLYQMINRANTILERIDEIPFNDPELKPRYVAEVRFLRAFAYFQLVRLFGRVPLITESITPEKGTEIGQSEPEEVFAFIVEEMSEAIEQLPPAYTGADVGRVTEWAAKGILARVYLTMAGCPFEQAGTLDEAGALLKEIIDQEGSYVWFADDYADLFGEDADNQHYLFEIQFVSGGFGAGSSFPVAILPNVSEEIAPFGGSVSANRLALSDDLLDSYADPDVRFDVTIDTFYVTNSVPADTGNTPYYQKFLDANENILDRGDWGVNFPVLRYTDVLLMYAEVLAEQAGAPTAEAVGILNRVRNRAGLESIQPASKEEFDQALLKERRLEFAAEGRYWFDLVRSCRAVEVMNDWFAATDQDIQINENHLIYPIPQSEIDIFPGLYQQNPGY